MSSAPGSAPGSAPVASAAPSPMSASQIDAHCVEILNNLLTDYNHFVVHLFNVPNPGPFEGINARRRLLLHQIRYVRTLACFQRTPTQVTVIAKLTSLIRRGILRAMQWNPITMKIARPFAIPL